MNEWFGMRAFLYAFFANSKISMEIISLILWILVATSSIHQPSFYFTLRYFHVYIFVNAMPCFQSVIPSVEMKCLPVVSNHLCEVHFDNLLFYNLHSSVLRHHFKRHTVVGLIRSEIEFLMLDYFHVSTNSIQAADETAIRILQSLEYEITAN